MKMLFRRATGGGMPSVPTVAATPSGFVVDDVNKRFFYTAESGTEPSDYEYSEDSGSTWFQVWANPQPIRYGAYAADSIWLRGKAVNGGSPSVAIKNPQPYTITGANVGKVKLVGEGDSITAHSGLGDSNPQNYPWHLSNNLDPNVFMLPIVNHAFGGKTWKVALDQYHLREIYDYNPAVSRNILFVQLGVNDSMVEGVRDPNAIIARMKLFINRAREQGYQVILSTGILPYHGDNEPSTSNTERQEFIPFTNYVRDHWREMGAAALVDLVNSENVGYSRAGNRYFWASTEWPLDRVHLAQAGYVEMAAVFQPVIEEVASRISLIPDAPTNATVNDADKTFSVSVPSNYTYKDLQFTQDGGATMEDATALTMPVTGTKAAGQVGFRIRSIGPNAPSAWVFNATGFTV